MNAALLHSRPAMLNTVACIALLYLLNAIHAGVFPLSISFFRSVSPFRLRTLPLIQQFKVANHTLCSMFYAFFIRIQLAQHSKRSKRSMCAMHGYYVQKPVSTFYSTALILVHFFLLFFLARSSHCVCVCASREQKVRHFIDVKTMRRNIILS